MLSAHGKQWGFNHAVLFSMLQGYLLKSRRGETTCVDERVMRELSDIASCHEALISVPLALAAKQASPPRQLTRKKMEREDGPG
jgi:hypothetical protein